MLSGDVPGGNVVCGACHGDNTKLTWQGNVGLMYPSDEYMVYGKGVDEKCYTSPGGCVGFDTKTGWVFNSNTVNGTISKTWLLSTYAYNDYYVLHVSDTGSLYNGPYSLTVANSYGIRPVVYLKSSIKITNGDGSEQHPYELSL